MLMLRDDACVGRGYRSIGPRGPGRPEGAGLGAADGAGRGEGWNEGAWLGVGRGAGATLGGGDGAGAADGAGRGEGWNEGAGLGVGRCAGATVGAGDGLGANCDAVGAGRVCTVGGKLAEGAGAVGRKDS